MDFGALSPEINSGRMYSGPGSGPLLAAAAAWDGLAAELSSTVAVYDSEVGGLAGDAWSGLAAAAMTAAVEPYVSWMSRTAAQAAQTAVQARAAAAAHDAAFSAMVPPGVIAANRSLLMSLIATNILGQNAAAIAATEVHYAEMWAQDAGAMYGYAGASAGATALAPFAAAPTTTNPAASTAQAAAAGGAQAQAGLTQAVTMVPHLLQSLAVSGSAQANLPVLDFLAGPLSPVSLFGIGGIPYLLAIQCVLLPMNGSNVVASVVRAQGPKPWLHEPAPSTADLRAGLQLTRASGPVTPAVSGGLGNAGSIGRLSVPPGWLAQTTTAKTVAAVFPEAGPGAVAAIAGETESGMLGDLAMGSMAGRALGATGGAASQFAAGPTGSLAGSRPDGSGKPAKPSKATIIVIPPSAQG
ncbi:PPE family protein [Mycobacterium sp. M1]|uniref:PPE family protein n=1 Tax=Mycolicibacter acidiphilus TaxID=2835306 RepID=A0ABS5REG0_9MYCO|nr:PPE family protein [Mycolicibacter acidiphilus]